MAEEETGRYGAVANIDLGLLIKNINEAKTQRIINIFQTPVATSRLTNPQMMYVAVIERLDWVDQKPTPKRCEKMVPTSKGLAMQCVRDADHEGNCE